MAFGLNYKKTDTSQKNSLGARQMTSEGEFLYTYATTSFTQYAFIELTKSWTGDMLTSTGAGGTPSPVGVCQVAFNQGEYGWVWVGKGGGVGKGIKGTVAASYAAGAKMTTTSTNGVVDDAACGSGAAPWRVLGVSGTSTDSGSGSAVELEASGLLSVDYAIPNNA